MRLDGLVPRQRNTPELLQGSPDALCRGIFVVAGINGEELEDLLMVRSGDIGMDISKCAATIWH
jgi:hypothetical protein